MISTRYCQVLCNIGKGLSKSGKLVFLLNEYVKLYGKEKWAVTTYSANMGIMEKNPAIDETLPKRNKKKREIWTAEMLMQAIETNSCYIVINKIIERVSVEALDFMDRKDIITIFPTQKRNNTTVVVMKTPKTETINRKVYIPSHVGKCLKELKSEQDHTKEILGNEYKDYNLVLATTFGMPIAASHVRTKMKQIIKKEGLPDVVFHSLRHTSVTYKLKLSGGDIKVVQGDSGHAQADMVTEVYGHILDEDRKKNAQLMENAFYNKENLNPDIHGASGTQNNNNNNMISVPEGGCGYAYESAWKSRDGSIADESGEVDEGIAYKTYKP